MLSAVGCFSSADRLSETNRGRYDSVACYEWLGFFRTHTAYFHSMARQEYMHFPVDSAEARKARPYRRCFFGLLAALILCRRSHFHGVRSLPSSWVNDGKICLFHDISGCLLRSYKLPFLSGRFLFPSFLFPSPETIIESLVFRWISSIASSSFYLRPTESPCTFSFLYLPYTFLLVLYFTFLFLLYLYLGPSQLSPCSRHTFITPLVGFPV